ncbi:MAG: signal peptidase I [Termitinemataceae bacterium]|nr:MAG: signal peptidase I [Termitinemataceae bacterium]
MLFNKSLKYSYADQKSQNMRIRSTALTVLIFLAIYFLFTNYLFSIKVLENSSMEPDLKSGDRFIFYSFALQKMMPDSVPLSKLPMRRGDIVLINQYQNGSTGFFNSLIDRLFRFFTIGQIGKPGKLDRLFIKRVIALSGDTVSMTNYVVRVEPAGQPYVFTEFELSSKPYNINIPQISPLWDSSIPFSGNMEKIVVESDTCFVLSDDRSNTNDSRTWGVINTDLVIGKALVRFWPPTRLGRP